MDFMNEFMKKTVMGMVGNEPNYKVRQYAANLFDKDYLTKEDLMELDAAVEQSEADNAQPGEGGENV